MNSPATQAGRAPEPAAAMVALLDDATAVARSAGRADLVQRLDTAKERVLDPRRKIVVVGPLKQGKSQFVNSLLNLTVCSVGDDETTAVPTVVQHAPVPAAELVLADSGGDPLRVPVPLDQITTITPNSPLAQGRDVLRLEIGVPSPLLADGLVIVDTPGVGGHGSPHSASVLGLVPGADAVLVLSDASTELTEPEVGFLRQVIGLCPAVACLVSKVDLYPEWRRIVDADLGHLQRNNIHVPILPVSSMLRSHALRLQDDELNVESGFAALYQFLRDNVVSRSDDATRRAVALDVRSTSEHIALGLASELAALRDPETGAAAVRELQRAKIAAEDLHKRTSLWQQSLGDGITDLAADIDHDLRERLRRVTRDAEEWVDERDPGDNWSELGAWLEDMVGTSIGDNFVWAHERSVWLAQVVAQHFAETGAVDLPHLHLADIDNVLEPVDSLADLESGRIGITQRVLVGMRGSYGGVLMFGMVTTLAGMALINPISIGAGVLLGTKAFREDKDARIARRRNEAKMAIRRYVEDVSFQANKESKDRLRQIQRVLRDHFAGLADNTLRSLNDSLRAAQDAATVASSDRAQRCAELEQQMRTVAELRTRSDRVLPAGESSNGRQLQ
ncbi:dynamin family protein [Antrihabitans cavernicola]|uniref:Isoniazid-inducible protein iniA n=1 Tax=Antrihabitans cavernicola TaxID=2495913 RepID=A0A5A7S8A7_9NOCA|nr:dynamin family protein [Spelaeibacter cavernicola]KAA0021439.1 Isoniazid-inducible protein iniA [Spelaeibacter cavernicola]